MPRRRGSRSLLARLYVLVGVLVCVFLFRRESSADICYLGFQKNNMRGWGDQDVRHERWLVTGRGLSGVRSSTLLVL